MSGRERHAKLRDRGDNLPVIFITGFDSAKTRHQAKMVGATGYFRKPIDDQALLDSIEWFLAKRPY